MFVQQRKRQRRWDEQSVSTVDTAASTVFNQPTLRTGTDESDAAATAVRPVNESPLSHTTAFDLKRTYPCRTCGIRLSSASNRTRHERAKHKDVHAGRNRSAAAEITISAGTKRSLDAAFGENRLPVEAEGKQSESTSELDSESVTEHATEDSIMETARAAELVESVALDPVLNQIPGQRPLLREEDLQASCYPFLLWLSQPPITQCEALVKARRVKSIAQLQPIKLNLRFIFALLYERESISQVDLQQLQQLSLCQVLFDAMTSRQVGSGRIHAVFLLLKKVLVYLSSQESAKHRQFIQPSTYESFCFVDNICSDSSHRRKQESRNRAVLGVQTSQQLHKSQPMAAHQAFAVPLQWGAGPPLKASIALVPLASPAVAAAAASSTSALAEDRRVPSNELSKTELQQVAKGCVAYLNEHTPGLESIQLDGTSAAAAASAAGPSPSLQDDRLFMAHLVTSTLCLGLAPRSQVLKQLRIGSSFIKQTDGRYWVKILAEMSKNGKPTMFAISAQLTAAFDHYLEVVRPRLLAQLPSAEATHDYVFVKRNGAAPRADFSACTCLVTQSLIGRPVNAHAFRAAVVTAFYETGASQSEMDVLATIMAHDPTTAKNFYYRPQIAAAAVQTNDRMAELLLQP